MLSLLYRLMGPTRPQNLMGLGVAFDLDKGTASARMLPQLLMLAARIIPQINIVKKRLLSRIGRRAVKIGSAVIMKLCFVAPAAIGAFDSNILYP